MADEGAGFSGLADAGGIGAHQDLLGAYAKSLTMENKPPPPPPIPVVPMNAVTFAANVAYVGYSPGNGAILLSLADQREAPVTNIGDKSKHAIFEIGRFVLTPRSLRQLLDSASDAAKAIESATGSPHPPHER